MKNFEKYERSYFMPPEISYDWVKKDYIDKAPIWCSVDLRDGNQALIEPMSLEEKIEFFQMLLAIGFKEIEVGFPAASETEYQFLRTLIEQNMIPDDVTIQVLTQAREHIIKKTFEAVKGAPHAVIHLYNSTSVAQREQVFKKSKEEVKQIAIDGAKLLKKLADETEGNFTFQYSPESFPGTEVDYALEVCNAVLEEWRPTKDNKVIINLPTTVENAMPHVFATQVEYMSKNLLYRENVILCLHPHNDRGCGVCDAELGVLAGADRIEGTLFGNGERTGNVDIITLAMNMFSHGVDPKLDFSNMGEICEKYERLTRMQAHQVLSVTDSASSVIMWMQTSDHILSIQQIFTHILYLCCKHMRHCIFNSCRKIDDDFIIFRRSPLFQHCIAHLQCIINLGSRKALWAVLKCKVSFCLIRKFF